MKSIYMQEKLMTLALCFILAYGAMLIPSDAFAGATVGNLLCAVVKWFTGPVGKGIATLAIIVIGVGALMGKVSWGMAIIVGLGVAVIFGAGTIVNELGNGSGGAAAGC